MFNSVCTLARLRSVALALVLERVTLACEVFGAKKAKTMFIDQRSR